MLIKRILALVGALLLTLALGAGVAAQAGPVAMDEPATFVDVGGIEHGTVTVTDVLDPFEDFPEGKDPEPGSKYVIVTFQIEGTGEDGIEVYPPSIWLHDSTGGVWDRSLPCCLMDDFPLPELSIMTVPQGSRTSGYVGYTVPADLEIDEVLYQAESGVLLIPADLGAARPTVGTPVTMTDTEGTTVVATVTEIEDPYKGFHKDSPPAEGGRFVMVKASLENTGDAPFAFELSGAVLRDARGAMWAPTSITPAKKAKGAPLTSVKLGPGDLVSGRLGYQIPADVAVDGVYYQGSGGLYRLADRSGAGAEPPTVGQASCDEITPWWGDVSPVLTRLATLPWFQADAPQMDLAASQDMLARIEALVDEHLAVTPPPSLASLHRQFLGALMLYAQSARDQVAAQKADDAQILFVSQEAFEAAQLASAQALASLEEIDVDGCADG